MRGWLDESAFPACRTWTTIIGGSRHLCLAPAKQPVPILPIQETGCGSRDAMLPQSNFGRAWMLR